MVFPVAMYGCESWTIKKAECFLDAFSLDQGSLGVMGAGAGKGKRKVVYFQGDFFKSSISLEILSAFS